MGIRLRAIENYGFLRVMNKAEAIQHFGSISALAVAVGVTHQAISRWPDPLPPRIADRVIAAALRKNGQVPPQWIECERGREAA